MANITFWGNILNHNNQAFPSGINYAAGSGLGFYGAGYGVSVPVGQFQDTTWVTNANGTAVDQYRLNNTKYASSGTVEANGANAINLYNQPNYYAPLKIRFSHSEAVRVQNARVKIFDRNNIEQHASGVTTQVYEVRHPNLSESASGLTHRANLLQNWFEFDPADGGITGELDYEYDLTSSPGLSGMNTSVGETVPSSQYGYTSWLTQEGASHESTIHDWYLNLSASPDSIGSKTDYGLYFTCEYL